MKNILLTRSTENNNELKNKLLTKEYNIFEESLIECLLKEKELEDLKNIIRDYTLLITSKFAALSLIERFSNLNLECYVVGKDTADLLAKNGFKIKEYFENIQELEEKLSPSSSLLYVRGEFITQKLKLDQKEVVIYSTIYKNHLSKNIVDQINNEKLDIVTIYSLKTAQAFINSAINSSISRTKIRHLSFYCFSRKIAEYFLQQGYKNLKFPERSNQDNFLDLF